VSPKLINGFEIRLTTPDCFPGADWHRVSVSLEDDITGVLPYLNTELKDADYNHDVKILLWNSDGRKYAFRPHEIAIAPVKTREEAQRLVKNIIRIVNDIWIRRDAIEPDLEGRKPLPTVLAIYKLLPGNNCKECGFLSCMAFATALRGDSAKLSLCPYISEREYLDLTSLGERYDGRM
jgi:ArsR family metal-binding transcriptional regulator